MSTGLVLEGGAMRGMYTAGVLDIFLIIRYPLTVLSVFQQELSLVSTILPAISPSSAWKKIRKNFRKCMIWELKTAKM